MRGGRAARVLRDRRRLRHPVRAGRGRPGQRRRRARPGRARVPARRPRPSRCPTARPPLGPDWALQVPQRLRRRAAHAVPEARRGGRRRPGRRRSASAPTSPPARWSRPSPTARRCASCPSSRDRPHAYVKLWKHHAAQPQADRINALAAARGEPWLPRYGGLISSEWEFAKGLQLLEEDPEVYAAMDRWVEAADWIVWQLCGTLRPQRLHRRLQGHPTRTAATRRPDFLAALNPDFAGFVDRQARPPDRPARRPRRRG